MIKLNQLKVYDPYPITEELPYIFKRGEKKKPNQHDASCKLPYPPGAASVVQVLSVIYAFQHTYLLMISPGVVMIVSFPPFPRMRQG